MTANQPEAPTIECACCGRRMDAVWQPPMYAGMTPYWLISCMNRACELFAYTFADVDYPSEDLFERYGIQNPPEAMR